MEKENVNPDFPSAIAGDNLDLGQEPSNDETTPKVEETTLNNEAKAPEVQGEEVTPKTEEGGDSKHSSKLISEIGEDRKKVVERFIESAKKSGVAAEELKELVDGDARLEKYIKSKFGNDYDKLMEGSLSTEDKPLTEVDRKKIEARAYAKAQLDVFKEQDAALKEKQFDLFAQSSGLTSEEAEKLREKADLLATHDEYENALKDALLLVNRDKANASSKPFQAPTGSSEKNMSNVPKEIVQDYMSDRRDANPTLIAQSAERVEKGMKVDSMGTPSYELQID